ncbi:MAG: hypothetical protein ACI97A_001767 [Planctomycetota bacterium]|jgi:hypothetical protein
MNQTKTDYTPYCLVILTALFALPLTLVLSQALGLGIPLMVVLMAATVLGLGWLCFGPLTDFVLSHGLSKKLIRFAAISVFAAGLTVGGVSLFIADVEQDRFVWHHHKDFGIKHNCFTCYAMAAYCDRDGHGNVYDTKTLSKPAEAEITKTLDKRFNVDAYPYPPPFLLVHRGLLAFSEDFMVLRRMWYLVVIGMLLAAIVLTATWCGAFRRNSALLFLPALLLAPTALTALQIQNVHPVVIASALLGMMALTRHKNLGGSLLLAFAILCKIWPAVLLVPLFFARKWSAIISTLLAVVSFVLVSLLVFGTGIFEDFISYQLPRLANGEAFGFMAKHAGAMTANTSIFGFWHKLYATGILAGDPPSLLNPILSWTYLLAAAGLIIWSARSSRRLYGIAFKDTDAGQKARLMLLIQWLAVMNLAQLRSPFLPWPYGVLSTLWLTLALAALAHGKTRLLAIGGFIYFSLYIPFGFASQNVNFAYGMIGTILIASFASYALIRLGRSRANAGEMGSN